MPKMAIFSHFGVIDFGRFWPTVKRSELKFPEKKTEKNISNKVLLTKRIRKYANSQVIRYLLYSHTRCSNKL